MLNRSVVPLGLPQSASRLWGGPHKFAVSPMTQILAASKDKSSIIVSRGAQFPTCLINTLNEPWRFVNDAVVAQDLVEHTTLLGAQNGIYRVDIGYDQHLVCDPSKIVGTLGAIDPKIVFTESRFDVARLWISWVFKNTWSGLGIIGSRLARGTIWSVATTKKLLRIAPSSPQLDNRDQGPMKLESASKYAREFWQQTKRIINAMNSSMFHLTHSKRVVIAGPTSVLIKT